MTSDSRYSPTMRALHWLVFSAAFIAVVAIDLLGFFDKGSETRAALFTIHQTAGLSVLLLMVLRVFARLRIEIPAATPAPRLLTRAAHMAHGILYVLMLGMPVLGLLALAWKGYAIEPFGAAWTLPLAPDQGLAHLARDIHESGATLVYILVGLHAAAALWHQFVLKDRLLHRMI